MHLKLPHIALLFGLGGLYGGSGYAWAQTGGTDNTEVIGDATPLTPYRDGDVRRVRASRDEDTGREKEGKDRAHHRLTGVRFGKVTAIGSSLPLNQYQSDLRINPGSDAEIAISMKMGFDERSVATAVTLDGGTDWSWTMQPDASDPDVAYDEDGRIHWTFIDLARKRLGYRRSTDAGKTWSAAIAIGAFIDHPQIGVDRTSSRFHNSIYVAGRVIGRSDVAISYSRDSGRKWLQTDLNLDQRTGSGFIYGPTILRNGSVVFPYMTHVRIQVLNGVFAGSYHDYYALVSNDGGKSFSKHYITTSLVSAQSGAGGIGALSQMVAGDYDNGQRLYQPICDSSLPGPARLMLTTSDDGGLSWTPPTPIVVSKMASRGVGSSSAMVNKDGVVGIQYFLVDLTNKFADIYFIFSRDFGKTWSTPMLMSDDPIMRPRAGRSQPRGFGGDQVYSDVDSAGNFHLIWPTAGEHADHYSLVGRVVSVHR